MSTYPPRTADHVLEEIKAAAAEDNVSLNQLLSAFIADGIGHCRAIMNLRKRAAGRNVDAAFTILDRAPVSLPTLAMSWSRRRDHLAFRPLRP